MLRVAFDLALRPLHPSDYDKGYVPLLEQLSPVGSPSREEFVRRALELADLAVVVCQRLVVLLKVIYVLNIYK